MGLTKWQCGKCGVVSQALPPAQPQPAGPCPSDPQLQPPSISLHYWTEVPDNSPAGQ